MYIASILQFLVHINERITSPRSLKLKTINKLKQKLKRNGKSLQVTIRKHDNYRNQLILTV